MTEPLAQGAAERLRRYEAVDRADAIVRAVDLLTVLDAFDRLVAQVDRLTPAKREPREELVHTTTRTHTKIGLTVAAAECPGCETEGRGIWLQCLSTRRPDKTTVRRRWECPRCTGRFTSYDKERVKP